MAHAHLQDLWWPPFENLYSALQEYKYSSAQADDRHLKQLLSNSSTWLRLGLRGFASPASDAQSLLQQGGHLKLRHGPALPIRTELQAATLALSQLMVSSLLELLLLHVLAAGLYTIMQSAGPERDAGLHTGVPLVLATQ